MDNTNNANPAQETSGTPQQKLFITDKALPQISYWQPGEVYEVKMKLRLNQVIDLIRQKQGVFVIESVEEDNDMPDMSKMDVPTFQRYTSEVKRKGSL